MLRSMRDESYKAIEEKYNLDRRFVKAFFHYYPTFYHLHVHFVHISRAESASSYLGRGVFLEDVIQWIELCPDYMKKATFVVQVGEHHQIYKIYKENNLL